jgi:hypothetical protein
VSVTVGGNSSNLSDLLTGGDVTLVLLEVVDNSFNSSLDTAAQIHGVAASSNVLDGLREDGTGEDGSGGGTVTSNLVGLGSDILEEASTEVLELVLERDGLGNRDTIYFSQYAVRFNYTRKERFRLESGETYPW